MKREDIDRLAARVKAGERPVVKRVKATEFSTYRTWYMGDEQIPHGGYMADICKKAGMTDDECRALWEANDSDWDN